MVYTNGFFTQGCPGVQTFICIMMTMRSIIKCYLCVMTVTSVKVVLCTASNVVRHSCNIIPALNIDQAVILNHLGLDIIRH